MKQLLKAVLRSAVLLIGIHSCCLYSFGQSSSLILPFGDVSQRRLVFNPDSAVVTRHRIMIKGQPVYYKATTGTLPVYDENGKIIAGVFYTYYQMTNGAAASGRPIVFLFNGGPGSASIWLHMGGYAGPVVANMNDEGYPAYPYGVHNNDCSILDLADLVYVDPVKTGYSRVVEGTGEHGARLFSQLGDREYLSAWINSFLSRYDRWLSPKYLVGESYGTTRVAGMAWELQEKFGINLNGVVLISANGLNFDFDDPVNAAMRLSVFADCSYKQGLLEPALQKKPLAEVRQEVDSFIYNQLMPALIRIGSLSEPKRDSLAAVFARFSGIPKREVIAQRFKIDTGYYFRAIATKAYDNKNAFEEKKKSPMLPLLRLPGLAATSWYHRQLQQRYLDRPLDDFFKEVEDFTIDELIPAFCRGDLNDTVKKKLLLSKIGLYIGLREEEAITYNVGELIQDGAEIVPGLRQMEVGFNDARYTQNLDVPSATDAYVSALNDYLSGKLNYRTKEPYVKLAPAFYPDFHFEGLKENAVKAGDGLMWAMQRNPTLKVLFQSGYYDRNCPLMLNKLQMWQLNPIGKFSGRIGLKTYYAGHMMYVRRSERIKANEDLRDFIRNTLPIK